MVNIIIGVQSNDERQTAAEALGRALRVGMDKQPSSYAASSAPLSIANGLYGAAMHSHAARAASEMGKERERKSGRVEKQGVNPSSRDGSSYARRRNDSLDPGVDGRSDHGSRASDRSRRPTDGEVSIM